MIPTEVQNGPRSLVGERRISPGLRTLELQYAQSSSKCVSWWWKKWCPKCGPPNCVAVASPSNNP